MRHIYTSIDLGSDSIKIVVCELFSNKLNLLAASSYKSRGIKNGLIIDPELAGESIKGAIKEIESMLGITIKSVIATIPSYNANFTAVQGKIEVNGIVNGNDISEVLSAAYRMKRIENKELVTMIPIDFGVDNEEKVKEYDKEIVLEKLKYVLNECEKKHYEHQLKKEGTVVVEV